MKNSLFFMAGLALFLTFFYTQSAEAGFSNSGRMQMEYLNLSVRGTLDNTGDLIGTKSANIYCDTFTGDGLISSPQIILKTKLFAYTGTINCKKKCTIIAGKPFDEAMFQRTGGGEFIVIIDQNLEIELPASISSPSELEFCLGDDWQPWDE